MKEKTFFQREVASTKELYRNIDTDTVKSLKDKLRNSYYLPPMRSEIPKIQRYK